MSETDSSPENTAAADKLSNEQSSSAATDAQFESLQNESAGPNEKPDLDVIMDIPVVLSLEVGQTPISIRNLLSLSQGSVIELDRMAGEPLDVLVNGTLIAHAEVVVVNEKFGLRLTDVVNTEERLNKIS